MKYYLSVVAIFKNESVILKEWLDHYLLEGVEHFYLIDNQSSDIAIYQPILSYYQQQGLVDLAVDGQAHQQPVHYNHYYLEKVKKDSEWVMVVDFDEFIYGHGKTDKIVDYLMTVASNVAQIYVPWKMFGSSGYLCQPDSIDRLIMRTQYHHVKTNGMKDQDHMLCKTIIRTKYLVEMGVHYSQVITDNTREITSDGRLIETSTKMFQKIDEQILEESRLHCNHYPIQAFDWFRQIKMTRGSALSVINDKVRTIAYYNSYELHSDRQMDTEMADKHNRIRVYYGLEKYVDVTYRALKAFLSVDKKELRIDQKIDLNNYLGDPVPGKVKYLIIKQGYTLSVYPENLRGNIVHIL